MKFDGPRQRRAIGANGDQPRSGRNWRKTLLVTSALIGSLALPAAAHAQSWVGGTSVPGGTSDDYNNDANWSTGQVPGQADVASFGPSNNTNLNFSHGSTNVQGWNFTSTTNYTFTIDHPLVVLAPFPPIPYSLTFGTGGFIGGAGITGNSSHVTINNDTAVIEFISASAGSATINTRQVTAFVGFSTAANATFNSQGYVQFYGYSTAGNATFNNTPAPNGGSVGSTQFHDQSTAGSATFNLNAGGAVFLDASTAGQATFTNVGGAVAFIGTATAGQATIVNVGGVTGFGFYAGDSPTAGNAVIITDKTSAIDFTNNSTAGNATIINAGTLAFSDYSTGGSATIANGGTTTFSNRSTADNADISNGAAATTDFSASSGTWGGNRLSAGSIAGGGLFALGQNELDVGGNNLSTAVSGVIADGGASGGTGASLVKDGTGTLTLSGNNTYSGGTRIDGGTVAISADSNLGTAGSNLAFAGGTLRFLAGVTTNRAVTLYTSGGIVDTNGNNATFVSTVSGAGSLTKTGTGTLTLSGNNTYSGGTAIDGGTLQIGNGGTTGSITGNVTDNATLAFNRSDAVTFGGLISGSGGVNQIGSGTTTLTGSSTYTGATVIAAGTLVLASAASITSNVTNAAIFQNSGTITGIVSNANTFDNNAAGTVSGRLTNTAGTTTSAGALNGGVTVSGGTFTQTGGSVSGGLSNAATANANGGAINGAITNFAGTFNVGGTVTSDSTFDNAGGATLAIGAAGNYRLQGLLTNSGAVTVASGGQLDATAGGITNAAGGSLTVTLGGTVKDDLNNAGAVTNNGAYLANVATNTGTITNNNSWTGAVATNNGTITNNNIWTGNVASSAGTITNNLTWNGAITTSGTFTNSAGATVTGLVTNSGTGSNAGTLSGGLTMTGGTFNNSGTIAGAITVSGGTLFGIGSVGTLTIANGGTFATGDGTAGASTSIVGSLAFASGAIYLVQVNPATSSFSTITGTATLGGATVSASFASGSYVEKQYTIMTAGSISGSFNPTVANYGLPSGFRTTLSYDGTHAYLNLALGFVAPSGTGLSGNQQNVGNALVNFFNSTGAIPIVFGALTPAGLTQLSGEAGTGSQQTTFNAMNQFMGVLTDPFITGRGDPIGAGGSPNAFADEETLDHAARRKPSDALAAIYTKAPPPPAGIFEQRWSVWAAGFGGSQTTDGNATLGFNKTTSSLYGTAVGADYRISPHTLAGFAIAGGGTNFTVASNLGGGRSDLFQAGAFVRHGVGPAYLTGALAYGWQDIVTDRTVTAAGVDRLRAEFKANAWSGRVEGGYRFVAWSVGLTPYAAGQFTTFDLPNYAEQAIVGSNIFALAYNAKTVTDTRSELGLRTDKSFVAADGIFTLRGRFAWAHDFSPDRSIGATFQALPGASFVVNGAAQAADAALVTASVEKKWLNGWSAGGTFEGEFSNITRSYAGKGVVGYHW